MTLAHYVRNEGMDPSVAMDAMKAKRHVVMVGVKNYPAIARLDEERLQKMSQAKSE